MKRAVALAVLGCSEASCSHAARHGERKQFSAPPAGDSRRAVTGFNSPAATGPPTWFGLSRSTNKATGPRSFQGPVLEAPGNRIYRRHFHNLESRSYFDVRFRYSVVFASLASPPEPPRAPGIALRLGEPLEKEHQSTVSCQPFSQSWKVLDQPASCSNPIGQAAVDLRRQSDPLDRVLLIPRKLPQKSLDVPVRRFERGFELVRRSAAASEPDHVLAVVYGDKIDFRSMRIPIAINLMCQ